MLPAVSIPSITRSVRVHSPALSSNSREHTERDGFISLPSSPRPTPALRADPAVGSLLCEPRLGIHPRRHYDEGVDHGLSQRHGPRPPNDYTPRPKLLFVALLSFPRAPNPKSLVPPRLIQSIATRIYVGNRNRVFLHCYLYLSLPPQFKQLYTVVGALLIYGSVCVCARACVCACMYVCVCM